MNKKQLIVTSILLSLMLLLVITQNFFERNFKQVVVIEREIKDFKEYGFNENEYFISFPSAWTVEGKECKGEYVSSKLRFKDKNNKLTGIVEVINTKGNLEVFAENDLYNQYLEYYNSEVVTFKNSNNSGVLAKYETSVKNGYDFRNECYYLNLEDGKTIKILFNIKEKEYNENIKIIIDTIIESIKPY
jgi:hypothetical protein